MPETTREVKFHIEGNRIVIDEDLILQNGDMVEYVNLRWEGNQLKCDEIRIIYDMVEYMNLRGENNQLKYDDVRVIYQGVDNPPIYSERWIDTTNWVVIPNRNQNLSDTNH